MVLTTTDPKPADGTGHANQRTVGAPAGRRQLGRRTGHDQQGRHMGAGPQLQVSRLLVVLHAVAVVNGFIRRRHRSVEWREMLPLIRRYVDTFEPYQVIAVPSGSCAGSIRHRHATVAARLGQHEQARRASAVARRTFELSQLLVDVLGWRMSARITAPGRLPSDLPLAAVLGVGDRPLRLLRNRGGSGDWVVAMRTSARSAVTPGSAPRPGTTSFLRKHPACPMCVRHRRPSARTRCQRKSGEITAGRTPASPGKARKEIQ